MSTKSLAPLLAVALALGACATGKDDVQPEPKEKEPQVIKADKDGVQRVRTGHGAA